MLSRIWQVLWLFFFAFVFSMNSKAGDGGMVVREYNFTSFSSAEKIITQTLLQQTPEKFQLHPEFGMKPYRTACDDCVELLHRRNFFSRYFIDPNNSNHFYVQQSFTPLHFLNKNGLLLSIDPGLRSDTNHSGIFRAEQQPVPTAFDKNLCSAIIEIDEIEFQFNGNLKMYFQDTVGKKIKSASANKTFVKVGEDGAYISNAWEKIDIKHVFQIGGVKTDFVINEPLNIPDDFEFLVFEDEIILPADHHFAFAENGFFNENDFWEGDLHVLKKSEPQIFFHQPFYVDGYGYGMKGFYSFAEADGVAKIQILVPVDFLKNPALTYPVYVDPLVTGRDSLGNFLDYISTPMITFTPFKFTHASIGECNDTLTVQVPGKCELFDALIDLEYVNGNDECNFIDTATCKFQNVFMRVSGPCSSTPNLQCNPATLPYVGTCTTDPRKVPGAQALRLTDFVACVPPQCPDYFLDFTWHKSTTGDCIETCGQKCARGSFFAVTVEGRTIELTITADKDSVCSKEPVVLTSFPKYGVPPYRYQWSPTNQTDSIITVFPTSTSSNHIELTYTDIAFDTCGVSDTASLDIVVKPTPRADAGRNTVFCDEAPIAIIGGNPTAPPTADPPQWTANPSYAQNFLSSTSAQNPTVNFPVGTLGSFEFMVEVTDAQCSQTDTVLIQVIPNPTPTITGDTIPQICEGESILLGVSPSFAKYFWSTGETTSTISAMENGSFTVTVTDDFGCTGSVTSSFLTVIPEIDFTIFAEPDSTIESGNSITLRADINLLDSNIDSFFWQPGQFITCSDCPAPIAMPADDILYSLTVQTIDGCISRDSIFIRVIQPGTYVIPSAFSPNEDNVNDQFFILAASGATVKEFKVFNRWGEMVHNAPLPWDGSYKDEPQNIGVYTYLFVLQLDEGGTKTESGTVTLVR